MITLIIVFKILSETINTSALLDLTKYILGVHFTTYNLLNSISFARNLHVQNEKKNYEKKCFFKVTFWILSHQTDQAKF